tara:strand:+ start:2026 stop:3813 length:1788 start_codon:yes stop_codon:yes gene_type:complete
VATYEWESFTLGQNPEIQKIVSAATKASELLNTNVGLAKTGLQLTQSLLLAILNPKIILLNAIADEIDKFVDDFRGTGFYILEVTPSGKSLIPTDADGNPIKLLLSAPAIATAYASAAAIGQTAEFLSWTKRELGIEDYATTGANQSFYSVEIGKSLPPSARTENADDDTMATIDPIFGMYKFTPSQVIAQTLAAMDDVGDERRPQFSTSAEVGAIMVIIGYSDMTTNIKSIKNVLNLFINFFGGDNGLFTKGLQQIGNLISGALGQLDDPFQNKVIIDLEQVSGTYDDDSLDNFEDVFEVDDFIIGPRIKVGVNALGYVTKVIETKTQDGIYKTQQLEITGVSELDAIAFRSIGSGTNIELGHYEILERVYIDDNTGEPVRGQFYNSGRTIGELSINQSDIFNDNSLSEAQEASTKVERKEGESLLTVKGKTDITELVNDKIVRKTIVGKIRRPVLPTSVPPDFKSAKLEDLIGGFTTFFSAIDTLSNTLRNIAGDSSLALKEMIAFLDSKIKELDELNKSLQEILKLFTIGLPDAGIYVLTIPPTVGGNNLIKDALKGASNRPPDSLDFSVGFLMMGGGPSMKVLNTLLASAK